MNTTPIHCLPVEVFQEIFIYVPMIEFQQSTYVHHIMPLWTSASQVCSLWRRITLDTPEFWTFMPLQTRHSRWTELSLTRSYPLPISLSINGSFCQLDWYRRALLRIAPAVSRAREIYWGTAGVFDDEQDECLALLAEAMGRHATPLLESFDGRWYHGGFPNFGRQVPLKLRRVNLRFNDPADHSSLLFQVPITDLKLVECTDFGLLQALRQLPSLETLVLIDSCDIRLPSSPVETSQVLLPRLRKLELHDAQYEAIVGFMHRVRVP